MTAKTIVLIEQDRGQVKHPSLHAITAARQLGGDYVLLLLGHNLDEMAKSIVAFGASGVVIADDVSLAEPLTDRSGRPASVFRAPCAGSPFSACC